MNDTTKKILNGLGVTVSAGCTMTVGCINLAVALQNFICNRKAPKGEKQPVLKPLVYAALGIAGGIAADHVGGELLTMALGERLEQAKIEKEAREVASTKADDAPAAVHEAEDSSDEKLESMREVVEEHEKLFGPNEKLRANLADLERIHRKRNAVKRVCEVMENSDDPDYEAILQIFEESPELKDDPNMRRLYSMAGMLQMLTKDLNGTSKDTADTEVGESSAE